MTRQTTVTNVLTPLLVTVGAILVYACNTFDSPPERQPPSPLPAPEPPPSAPPAPPAPTFGPCGTRVDLDGDGVEVTLVSGCAPGARPPIHHDAEDCDDADPDRHVRQLQYVDADGDGFGDGNGSVAWTCVGTTLVGFVPNGTDCNDASAAEFATLYLDRDGDGFGETANSRCGAPQDGWATTGGDCDDAAPSIHPGATPEVALDGIDVDCDQFDVPYFPTPESGKSHTWQDGPLCSGSAFAFVGIERLTTSAGGVVLHIANVGTVETSGVVLMVSQVAGATHTFELPSLTPGQVTQSERIPAGIYRASFNYDEVTSHDSGIANSAEKDSGADAATSNNDRCALSRLPLAFSSSMPHL